MAISKILLVSEREIKDNTKIEENVEPKLLNLIVRDLQHNQLRKMIGIPMYNELMASIELYRQDGTPLSDFQTELKDDYIKPWLYAAVVADFAIDNQYKATNKGLLKMDDTQAKGVDSGELEYNLGYLKLKVATAKANLLEFLKTDSDSTCSNGSQSDTNADLGGLYLVNRYQHRETGRNRYL